MTYFQLFAIFKSVLLCFFLQYYAAVSVFLPRLFEVRGMTICAHECTEHSRQHGTLEVTIYSSSGPPVLFMRGKGSKSCRNPGSNQGPLDLQSNALPTELFRREVLEIDDLE